MRRFCLGLSIAAALGLVGCGADEGPTPTNAADVPVAVDSAAADAGPVVDSTSALDASLDDAAGTDGGVEADTAGGVDDIGMPSKLPIAVREVYTRDGSAVRVLFDRQVAPSVTQAAATFVFEGTETGEVAVSQATLDPAQHTLMLVPATPLTPDQTWTLTLSGVVGADQGALAQDPWVADVMGTMFLNLVWHQHQPSYLDPTRDELQGPWVRKHAQKDYFDMTAMLADHPKVHVNVNLTSSLLNQLDFYLTRLGPYVDVAAETVDEAAFEAAGMIGHTDPWIDLLLADTPAPEAATDPQKDRYYAGVWSCKSISEPLSAFFPEYAALLAKTPDEYTRLDLNRLKLWFELAWMDPGFLVGPVVVSQDETGADVVVDLSDVVDGLEDGTFVLTPYYTDPALGEAELLARGEALANRLVAVEYKIMAGVFAIHKKLMWDGTSGQVEVLTTPFFHPILPLLFSTDLAAEGQPADPMPTPAFAHPEDVTTQIQMAVAYYTERFGTAPRGMWPSEGAVAEEIVPAFVAAGIDWIATDRQVLAHKMPNQSHLFPYMVDADTVAGDGGDTSDELMIVFRDTALSDKVGFAYQSQEASASAADFVAGVWAKAPRFGEPSRLMSVILDGENAWEWYTQDHDAKSFLTQLYKRLDEAYDVGQVVTVTGSEYIDGNPARGVVAHPVAAMTEYEDLFPGSWIGGRLDTWIGETEENLAWAYLRAAREDLAAAQVSLAGILDPPADLLHEPTGDEAARSWWRAWRAMLSAEGSDWFWWYGADQTAAGGDDSPFDAIFRAQLLAMYGFANEALVASGKAPLVVPTFPPILQPKPTPMTGAFVSAPVLDGAFSPDETEWTPPAGVVFDNDTAGAIDDPNDDIARLLYGYTNPDGGAVYLAIAFKEDLSAKLGTDYRVAVYTNHGNLSTTPDGQVLTQDPWNEMTEEGVAADLLAGGAARQVLIDFSGSAPTVTVARADGAGGWTVASDLAAMPELGGPADGGSLLELKIPLAALDLKKGDPLELKVVAAEGLTAVDWAPTLGSVVVFADPTKLVTVIMELDVTGEALALDAVSPITDPPPPAGTGQPSIVGAPASFGSWTPNTVAMRDDGVAPDLVMADGIYTLGAVFSPGDEINYKYTIGHDGESWGGTEEFPLTNRLLVVPKDGTQTIRVRDIFADRPDPSGTMAKLTTVTSE